MKRLALIAVFLAPLALAVDPPAKPSAPTLTNDQKHPLEVLVAHQAQLQLAIVGQQQTLTNLQQQLQETIAAWQKAQIDALKAAKIDPDKYEVQLDTTGDIKLVEKPKVAAPVEKQ